MWSSRPYTFDRVVRIVFTLAVLAGLIFLAAVLRHVLLPFVRSEEHTSELQSQR